MVHKQTEFYLVTFLYIFFFLLLSFASTLFLGILPDTLNLFGPALGLIAFNLIVMYMFTQYVPFSLKLKPVSLILSFVIAVPFAGIFIILKEPFPPYQGILFAFMDAFFVSLAEEVSFRGIIAQLAEQAYGIRFAYFFQALFFTILHFHFTAGFIIGYMVFSFAAYWLYNWQGKNIAYPIILHTVTNFLMYLFFLNA